MASHDPVESPAVTGLGLAYSVMTRSLTLSSNASMKDAMEWSYSPPVASSSPRPSLSPTLRFTSFCAVTRVRGLARTGAAAAAINSGVLRISSHLPKNSFRPTRAVTTSNTACAST